jgi:Tfp pilus assembly protein PilF
MQARFLAVLVLAAGAALGAWWLGGDTVAPPRPVQRAAVERTVDPRPDVAPEPEPPAAQPAPAAPVVTPEARREAAALLASAAEARAGGDLRAAVGQLQAAVERAPSVETHAALGALYLEMGVTSAADTQLRAAAEGDPGNADRWIALANAYYLKPDPGAAADALSRAREVEPGLRVTRNADGWLVREAPAPQP